MKHWRKLTVCDSECAYANHCAEGGYQCERCGCYYCPDCEGEDGYCDDCTEEISEKLESRVRVGETPTEITWESLGIERPSNLEKAYPILHNAYCHMMQRCGLHKYSYHGESYFTDMEHYRDRGITVCDEWRGKGGMKRFILWALANGWQPGLVFDRRDNDKGYSPDNCRWVTWSESNRNRRMTEKMRAALLRRSALGRAAQGGVRDARGRFAARGP